ncbi:MULTISPECIES: DUF2852 domain-containing protein [unclassified Roseitalea]|uniref:DUF2852 domain-containing protein n=1 Tax=unclassified Roseitalea TaxID=2639107 RepID=UPI00273D4A1C|nr:MULTISPECIES: DUF2852 domain-containing protein [unclassified Roseitalea]
MTQTAMIRPAWTPATIGLMVLGFIVFWPLGLAMLAYILWGDRLDEFKGGVNRATDDIARTFGRGRAQASARTGNVAFDDWREAELKRIEQERRKLDEMREEFDSYLRELRRAKDQQEFDAFMAARKSRTDTGATDDGEPRNGSVPGVRPNEG